MGKVQKPNNGEGEQTFKREGEPRDGMQVKRQEMSVVKAIIVQTKGLSEYLPFFF